MAVLSTLRELSLPYNCYEIGHPSTPFCSKAALDAGLVTMREALKIYGSLYGLSQVLQKKFSVEALYKTLQSTLTSSCFLAFNVFCFHVIFCLFRKIMGKFYYLHCSYLPGFLSSFLAIMIERKNRQIPLAMYVTNVATETLFRMAVSRGIIKPIPYGEILMFSAAMSYILYSIKKYGYSDDIVSIAIRYILGEEKRHSKERMTYMDYNENGSSKPVSDSDLLHDFQCNICENKKLHTHFRKLKHMSCLHKDICPVYILKGFVYPLLLGCGVRVALKILSSPFHFILRPLSVLKLLTQSQVIYPGLFLSGFSGIYKLTSCLLRWIYGKDDEWHAIPAGILASCAMFIYPSPSISLYIIWKLVEKVYRHGMTERSLPRIPGGILLLYALSTALLLYAAILEPHNIKPAYLNFINRITNNKLTQINRHVLDIFGTHASKLYNDFFPEVDLHYTSRAFQETVLVWLIR